MQLRKIQCFVTLVEEGNFSKAAKAMFITQPALSWNIKELEEELGTQLVKRSSSGIEVTETGMILYEGAKPLLSDLDRLKRTVKNTVHVKKRRIKCGMTILSSIEYMGILQYFSDAYTEYIVEYTQRGSKEIQQMVVNGHLDIGIVSDPIYYPALNDTVRPLEDYFYEVGVVVHKNHSFANADHLSINDLDSVPLAMMTQGFSMGNEIEKRFEELGVNYNVVFQNENWEVMIEHVSTYRSIALLPYPIRNLSHRDDIVWIPLKDEKVGRFNLSLVTSLNLKKQENKLMYDRYYENLISTQSH